MRELWPSITLPVLLINRFRVKTASIKTHLLYIMAPNIPVPVAPTVPHSPLDLIPVPTNSIFCKACCTVHATRVQLCPAGRLDICTVHKTVYLPHEKSLLHQHLRDVDTECPDCTFGSEKKVNKALKRENSRALRPAINHKDTVFCVYCWAPATKKCTHLASCREHSMIYLRSQVDINSKWWLRPSDFACLLCPLTGVMPKKAGEWKKALSQGPSDNLFGSDWDHWRNFIPEQIYRLRPGAFQSWDTRCEFVAWMDKMGQNEMLFMRFLAYQGTYPITCMYAETGTIPRMAANVPTFATTPTLAVQMTTPAVETPSMSAPPPYASPVSVHRTVQPTPAPVPSSEPPAPVFETAVSSRQTFQQPAATMLGTQLTRSASFNGIAPRPETSQLPVAPFRHNPAPPRRTQSQTMHHRGSRRVPSQSQASQIRSAYYTEPAQIIQDIYDGQIPPDPQARRTHRETQAQRSQVQQSLHSIYEVPVATSGLQGAPMTGPPLMTPAYQQPYQSQPTMTANGVYSMGQPALSTEAELAAHLRRVSIANAAQQQHQSRPSFPIPGIPQYIAQQPAVQAEPQIQPNVRRVSFAAETNHQTYPSQYSPIQDIYNLYPSHSREPSVASHTNPAMAEYMDRLHAARRPPPSRQSQRRNSTLSIPGTYPPESESDWETTASEDEAQASEQVGTQPEIPPARAAGVQHMSYHAVPQQNPMYAEFQRGYAQAALGNGVGQYGTGNTYAGR